MTQFYRRTTPEPSDDLVAGLAAAGLAAGVAVVTFYLVRLWLAREPLESSITRVPEGAAAARDESGPREAKG